MAGGNLGDAIQAKLRGNILSFEVNASVTAVEGRIYRGSPVAVRKTTSGTITEGYASNPSDAIDVNWAFVGMAEEECDLTAAGAANGDKRIRVRRHGIFKMKVNSGAAALSHVGKMAYVKTQHTSAATFEIDLAALVTYKIAVGLIVGYIDADYVYVDITPAPWSEINLAAHVILMQSSANGEGAALVGIEDANGWTDETAVELALDEIYENLTENNHIAIPITAFTEEAGDILTVTADGTIGFKQLTNEEVILQVAAAEPFASTIGLPSDADGTKNMTLSLMVQKNGTDANDATMNLEAYAVATGAAALSSDDAYAGAALAITDNLLIQVLDFTLLAASLPAVPRTVSIIFTAAGTDELYIYGASLKYSRTLV